VGVGDRDVLELVAVVLDDVLLAVADHDVAEADQQRYNSLTNRSIIFLTNDINIVVAIRIYMVRARS
jgi:hypothetical protein